MENLIQKAEHWKIVDDYQNYEVSNTGLVRNSKRNSVLKPSDNGSGYLQVVLSKNNQQKTFYVHRLVAIAFVGNPKKLIAVNHLNSTRNDNKSENLEWTSILENCCHGFKNKATSSQYTGVTYNKKEEKWVASIFHERKVKILGTFKNETEAYQARVNFETENNILNKYL